MNPLFVAASGLIAYLLARPLFGKRRLNKAQTFVLKNNVLEVHISAPGGIIQRLLVGDKDGIVDDIVLGHDKLSDYLKFNQYFGAVIGRVANRIAYGRFTADGQEYQLATNNGSHHLHGGVKGWDKALWKGTQEGDSVTLAHTSPDGDEGYPGNVEATITYTLNGSTLRAVFEATTDRTTPINMAQHSYFNLAGHASGNILGHRLQIKGVNYTPKDAEGIPTGEIAPVAGTPLDFQDAEVVGSRIQEVEGGYDHNYVLHGLGKNAKFASNQGPKLAAELEDPVSGRVMRVLTTAPGMQLYTGNFVENVRGKEGALYQKHAGLCLETQGFPNAVNEVAFPIILYRPEEKYSHEVVYQFSWR
jgi:aldose 1-epimerase